MSTNQRNTLRVKRSKTNYYVVNTIYNCMITCNSLPYALKAMQHMLFDVQQSRY